MTHAAKRKTFISYHHEPDQEYADLLRKELADDIIDKAVSDGSITDNLTTDEIWWKIRDDHISDATVMAVLIGRSTCSRKYVDWEIGSGFSKTKKNSRCGVLGILLPDHPSYGKRPVDPKTLPRRLAANIEGSDPYVRIYDWPRDNRLSMVRDWIEVAFQRRKGPAPNNNSKRFQRNRSIDARESVSLEKALFWGAAAIVAGVTAGHIIRRLKKPPTRELDASVQMRPPAVGVRRDLIFGSASARSLPEPFDRRQDSRPTNTGRRRVRPRPNRVSRPIR